MTTKVDAGAITSRKLAEGARQTAASSLPLRTTEKIAYRAITNEKVGPEEITGDQVVEASLFPGPKRQYGQ